MKVLLVDDHPIFLEGLHNLLLAGGVDVVGTAGDGLQALAQARTLRPDVILMDIEMPRCDGLTAARLIKAELPDTKIVMLTMSAEDADLFEAIKSGASGYLLKRLNADEFFDYLSELMKGQAPFSPGLAARILAEFARQGQSPTPSSLLEDAALMLGKDPDLATAPQAAQTGSDEPLSARQIQILALVAQGHTYKEVAEIIGLSERTIKYHMAAILEQLHLKNRSQLIAYAARRGMGTQGQSA